jgi:hypothetical protein
MAGPAHDVLVQALRDDATLLPAILARLRRRRLPRLSAPIDSAVRLARPIEVRPDVVHRTPSGWVACEVQNKIDPRKPGRWILTAAVLFDQTGHMGDLIVITASASVARWARRVAHALGPAGTLLRLRPVVLYLGLRSARKLLDSKNPALALCAAWAMQHRHGPEAARVVESAVDITERLPPPLREAQRRAILEVLNDKMLSRLREAAMQPIRVTESPRIRKLRLFLEGIAEKRGRAEERVASKREDLLMVLSERGLPLTREQRTLIGKCADADQLALWHRRAITAASVADVLAATVTPAAARKPAPIAKAAGTTKPRKAAPTARRTRPSAKASASR